MTILGPLIKWPIIDRFGSLRCLWKCLDKILQYIILELSKTTSLVAKSVTKKTFEVFFNSIQASQKLLYSLCISKYMKMINITWIYGPRTTTFAHKVYISTTLVTQSFDFKITYFRCLHLRQELLLFRYKLLNKTRY